MRLLFRPFRYFFYRNWYCRRRDGVYPKGHKDYYYLIELGAVTIVIGGCHERAD